MFTKQWPGIFSAVESSAASPSRSSVTKILGSKSLSTILHINGHNPLEDRGTSLKNRKITSQVHTRRVMRTRVADKHRRCRVLGTIAARRGGARRQQRARGAPAERWLTGTLPRHPAWIVPPGPFRRESDPQHTSNALFTRPPRTCATTVFVLHCLNRFMQYRLDHASASTSPLRHAASTFRQCH